MSAGKKWENPVFNGFCGKYGVPLFLRRMGLEPARDCSHKILSLARLPVPTPPLTTSCSWRKWYINTWTLLCQLFFFEKAENGVIITAICEFVRGSRRPPDMMQIFITTDPDYICTLLFLAYLRAFCRMSQMWPYTAPGVYGTFFLLFGGDLCLP